MIYMIKKTYILILILITSCANLNTTFSTSPFVPLISNLFVGGESIELSDEYISNQPYSFLRADFGQGSNVIMVLQKIENGLYTWTSEYQEKITTYNGKIIKTQGLNHNIEIMNPSKFKYFSNSNNYIGVFNTLLKEPTAFIEQQFAISMIEQSETLLFEEKIYIEPLNQRYSNFYWLDGKTGQAVKTKQKIHPDLPTIRLDFIYKY